MLLRGCYSNNSVQPNYALVILCETCRSYIAELHYKLHRWLIQTDCSFLRFMSLNDQRQFGQNTHKTASLIYIHHPHLIHTVLDNSEEIDESCTLFNAKLN